MQTLLEHTIQHAHVPGASVAEAFAKGTITKRTAGIANTETGQAVTNDTTFEAASLSKPVFAYIVLKMVESGKFSRPGETPLSGLDRPLYEMAPFGPPELREEPYKKHYESLTAQMILSHQSGLPNKFPPHPSPLEYLALPGTQFDYSGEAFCFLMDVVIHNEATRQVDQGGQGLSENDFDSLSQQQKFQIFEQVAQKEFATMGMNHSSFIANTGSKPVTRATGHNAEGVSDTEPNFPQGFTHPGASLVTTAEDYAKFLHVCTQDTFIRKTMFKSQIELTGKDSKAIASKVSPDTLSHLQWGLGIGLQTTKDGSTIAFHWGDNATYRAFAAINLNINEAAVCLTNSTNGPRIFRPTVEPVVGDLNAVSEWLSRREGLPVRPTRVQIQERMTEGEIPGASIAYLDLQKGRPIIEPMTIGVTDVRANHPHAPVEQDTVFGVASLSKPVFSYLALKLIADNMLGTTDKPFGLDTPLSEIFPENKAELEELFKVFNTGKMEVSKDFIEEAKKLTARMILSHTTGIPIDGSPRFVFTPGTQYSYGNTPLNFLKKAIEKRTGQSLEALAQEVVFEPLHMDDSSFYPTYDIGLISDHKREPGKIYLNFTETELQYEVIGLDKEPKKGTIPLDKLPKYFPMNIDKIIQSKKKYLPMILDHTAAQEHTPWGGNAANSLRTTPTDYARLAAAWMDEKDCGLLKMSSAPTVANLQDSATSLYILTGEGFFYYNKAKKEIQTIVLDESSVEKLHANFPEVTKENPQIKVLSTEQLKEITEITGHTNPLQEAFRPQISLTEDQWAIDRKVKENDMQHLAWGLGLGLELDDAGDVTTAFHTGDMNQWRGWVAMDVKAKSAVVYFANGDDTKNKSGHGYGHVLADVIVSPEVKLTHALDWFFPKFGFSRNVEPGWKAKERTDTALIDDYVEECLASPPNPLKETRELAALEKARDVTQRYKHVIDDVNHGMAEPSATAEGEEVEHSSPSPCSIKLKPSSE